jgi:hypothetical protein
LLVVIKCTCKRKNVSAVSGLPPTNRHKHVRQKYFKLRIMGAEDNEGYLFTDLKTCFISRPELLIPFRFWKLTSRILEVAFYVFGRLDHRQIPNFIDLGVRLWK